MKKLAKFLIPICIGFFIAPGLVRFYVINTTDPPAEYMIRNMEEQMGCLRRAGIVIKPPMLRVMKMPYEPGSPHGYAYGGGINIVLLVYFASYKTIAHELGHIVDFQTGRKGPLFDKMQDLPIQVFADAIRDIIIEECKFYKQVPP